MNPYIVPGLKIRDIKVQRKLADTKVNTPKDFNELVLRTIAFCNEYIEIIYDGVPKENYTPITLDSVKSKSRARELVICRHLIWFAGWHITNYSLARMGRYVGNRDHTTVIHGRETMSDLLTLNTKQARIIKKYLISIGVKEKQI